MKSCEDFDPITHQRYKDAGCFGCSFLMMWTNGYYDCRHESEHSITIRVIDSKAFGLTDLVVRYNDD